jgi:hypothetical protein
MALSMLSWKSPLKAFRKKAECLSSRLRWNKNACSGSFLLSPMLMVTKVWSDNLYAVVSSSVHLGILSVDWEDGNKAVSHHRTYFHFLSRPRGIIVPSPKEKAHVGHEQ